LFSKGNSTPLSAIPNSGFSVGLDRTSASEAVATILGNIGPGLAYVGPSDNYAHIPMRGKWIFSVFILAGCLEIYTVLLLLAPSFWKN